MGQAQNRKPDQRIGADDMSEKITSPKPHWEKPELRRVGDVSDVLQFPGEGKLSLAADDMGDAPRKPSGQEMK
jgi:hypothetical protein